MKRYFYTNGIDKIGPFSLEELKNQNLSRETKIWFYGLDNWTVLSEIEELKDLSNSIPPPLKTIIFKESKNYKIERNNILRIGKLFKNLDKKTFTKYVVVLLTIATLGLSTGYIFYNKYKQKKLYNDIAASAFETEVDFNFYVEKFYRDVGNYGIFPTKPKVKIIKFAKLDQLLDATHIHGISYGINDDDKIEIYINPTTWKSFNKQMRYFLMYHELSHDVLNLDDLEELSFNEGKLMYPTLAHYESKTMDDFIESSHALFEEISKKIK